MAYKIKTNKKKKMVTYVNSIGCKASFDSDISEEQVNKRLSWMGSGWRKE